MAKYREKSFCFRKLMDHRLRGDDTVRAILQQAQMTLLKNFLQKLLFFFPFWLFITSSLSAITLEEAIKLSLETNPTILADKAAMCSSKEAIDIARAGYFPSLNLTNAGGYQYTKERSQLTPFSSAFSADANRLSNNVNLTLSQLIFDGFLTINQVKQAKVSLELQPRMLKGHRKILPYKLAKLFTRFSINMA